MTQTSHENHIEPASVMPIEQYESCASDAALDDTEVSWEDLLLKICSKKLCFQFVRIRWEAWRCAAQGQSHVLELSQIAAVWLIFW